MYKKKWIEWLWEAWCIFSIVGIWPRFIEPKILSITRLSLPIPFLPPILNGFKILQFSDLHWHSNFSKKQKNKIIKKINRLKPDIIVFTGDFICRSKLEDGEGLKKLLNSLEAPAGCFAVLGNHDYDQFVTVNDTGDYDLEKSSSSSDIVKGFKRLFSRLPLTGKVSKNAQMSGWHPELIKLLNETHFQLLANETKQITFNGATINICGLEEYSLGKADLPKVFNNYDSGKIGIVLCHNPDMLKKLSVYPGDLILSGHTHGGQVNLPFLWKKFTKIENLQFKRGLKKIGSKWAYINRGLGGIMDFRWFSRPELTLITLEPEKSLERKKDGP
ncbi:MAG: UDP-2,3-diacylglucosamine diphosphatase LpxG [Candidatus Protochlamydia sp.]|nr:UDP-2,3-diacylglucosamine diphosphatase LpxG [Candidatus Protochlamydia sp.]